MEAKRTIQRRDERFGDFWGCKVNVAAEGELELRQLEEQLREGLDRKTALDEGSKLKEPSHRKAKGLYNINLYELAKRGDLRRDSLHGIVVNAKYAQPSERGEIFGQ